MQNMMIESEKELKEQFNEFFGRHNIQDLYDQLSIKERIELKQILSCINNIITLRATIEFVNQLYKDGFISLSVCYTMQTDIKKQHANANGFDVKYEGNDGKNIIAEVKCNIPANGKSSFGANQQKRIIEDIKQLQSGKSTVHLKSDISEYYKFMVILDCDKKIKECMAKIAKKTPVIEYTTPNKLDKEHVFVMYVTI